MFRSALARAGALVALGVLVWLLTRARDATVDSTGAPTRVEPVLVPPAASERVQAPRNRGPTTTNATPRISNRDELAQVLEARGLDAEKFIAGYRAWRMARGFLGADPLAGITTENATAQSYAAMDRSTQKGLADSGDIGAIQAYAAGSLPGDPFTALKYYGHASELGSAAAMAEVASILSDLGSLQPGTGENDRPFADKLLALRGGIPNRDLRQDAVAWTLASIRQYGPILATPTNMELVGDLESNPDKAVAMGICVQSLAILATLSAATAGQDTAALPPVFVTEMHLYDRLPCRDTPAPVTPPRALEACTSSPATGSNDQPIELWICPEN